MEFSYMHYLMVNAYEYKLKIFCFLSSSENVLFKSVIVFSVGWFGYKLYRSLKEKNRRKEEKKKAKHQKKDAKKK